jgi:Ser/Thr protein kinase RdoA (MazF antagonist)
MPGLTTCDARNALQECYRLCPDAVSQAGQSVFQCSFADRRTMFLKTFDPIFSDKADALGSLCAFISRTGLTPRLAADCNGELIPIFKGTRLMLQFSGQTGNDGALTRGTPCPELFAQALSALHEALRNYSEAPPLHSHLEQDPQVLSDFACQLGLPEHVEALHRTAGVRRQIIHGDLHPGNILLNSRGVIFLDFDSACVAPPRREAAFAAYRLFQTPSNRRLFLDAYVRETGGPLFEFREMHEHLFHVILSRIHFILMSATRHETRFLYDLPLQMQRLEEIRQALSTETKQ